MKHTSVFLVGLMAVGKSSVGRQLADELGYSFYDSDHEVEIRAGAEIAWISMSKVRMDFGRGKRRSSTS